MKVAEMSPEQYGKYVEYHVRYREKHREELAKKSNEYYHENAEKCSAQRKQHYIEHIDEMRERGHAWYRKHKEANPNYGKEQYEKYRKPFPEKMKADRKKYVDTHKEKISEEGDIYKNKVRTEILKHYGGVCACCGETNYAFLSIDHVFCDGNTQRRELGLRGGTRFYNWLKKNGFPSGYRVLCHNCNFTIGHYGFCPHMRESKLIGLNDLYHLRAENKAMKGNAVREGRKRAAERRNGS
jgi:hypothetical protein